MAFQRSERLATKLLALLAVVATLFAPTPASAAGDISPVTDQMWDVGDADTEVDHTGEIRALVWDIEEYDGRVYVAGKFLNVYAPNGDLFPQPYLVAFDLETGQWDADFFPRLRGPAYSIDITANGTILAGGEIPGGLQAVDPVTGDDVPGFTTDLAHTWGRPAIFDIEVVGDQAYIGGRFTSAGDVALENLARVNAETGAIDSGWRPTTQLDMGTPRVAGTNVYGLAVDAARDRVYLAGKFGSVNGDPEAAYFATVDTGSGTLRTDLPQGLPPGVLSHREYASMGQFDVQFGGDRVYLGGQAHQTLILDSTYLAPLRSYATNQGFGDDFSGGDTQALHVGATTVWAGCHCWGSLAEYPVGSRNSANPSGDQSFAEYRAFMDEVSGVQGSHTQQPVSGLYGIDIATGNKLATDFGVNGQAGAWALLEDSNGRLWAGGQFTQDVERGTPLKALARFSPAGIPPEPVAAEPAVAEPVAPEPVPEAAPSRPPGPVGLHSTYQDRQRIVLNWNSLPGAVRYEVLQNGVPVGSDTDLWWTHLNLPSATTWSYSVRATLADGTVTAESAPIVVATTP